MPSNHSFLYRCFRSIDRAFRWRAAHWARRDAAVRLGIRAGLWVLAVMVAFGVFPFLVSLRIFRAPWNWEVASQIGDALNVANTLFSGLALAGVIIAIYLQTKELKLQRQELKETREELERTATAQENTERTLKTTAFLNASTTLMEAYRLRMSGESLEGLGYYRRARDELIEELAWSIDQLQEGSFIQSPQPSDLAKSRIRRLHARARKAIAVQRRNQHIDNGKAVVIETKHELTEISKSLLGHASTTDPWIVTLREQIGILEKQLSDFAAAETPRPKPDKRGDVVRAFFDECERQLDSLRLLAGV